MSAANAAAAPLPFSVIIPTLNEVEQIADTLSAARRAFGASAEYIVVDGGSRDGTPDAARALGAIVLTGPAGRGLQMQTGASAARGEVMLFLHADTLLPADSATQLTRALRDPAVVGGAFALDFTFEQQRPLIMSVLARAITLRSHLFRTATGDQCIFARSIVLHAIGGVPREPLFEDVLLFRRLRAAGRVVILPARVKTSPRLWQRVGPFKLIVLHLGFRLLHGIGVAPARLARWYYR
jgi:rSAM/selenodomain-associated transferase 2